MRIRETTSQEIGELTLAQTGPSAESLGIRWGAGGLAAMESYHGYERHDSQEDEANPSAPKLETEPRVLESHVILPPFNCFLLQAFTHVLPLSEHFPPFFCLLFTPSFSLNLMIAS